MGLDSFRHYIYLSMIFVFILFAFMGKSANVSIAWAVFAGIAITLCILGIFNWDVMFFGQYDFMFEPDYTHWKVFNDSDT